MSSPSWRARLAPIIRAAIEAAHDLPPSDQRAVIRQAWPAGALGERRGHPYRIWCSEVRRQLGMPRRRPAPGSPNSPQLSLPELCE